MNDIIERGITMNNILHLYHNENYLDANCFFIYLDNNTKFLIKGTDIIDVNGSFSELDISNDIVDSYADSRGFKKVLDFDKTSVRWYNNYYANRDGIKESISSIKDKIMVLKRITPIAVNNRYGTIYGYISLLYDLM